MNNFYLTLLSDSSLSTFSKNTQCDFKVKLDHSIQIEKDNWEVGLMSDESDFRLYDGSDLKTYLLMRW